MCECVSVCVRANTGLSSSQHHRWLIHYRQPTYEENPDMSLDPKDRVSLNTAVYRKSQQWCESPAVNTDQEIRCSLTLWKTELSGHGTAATRNPERAALLFPCCHIQDEQRYNSSRLFSVCSRWLSVTVKTCWRDEGEVVAGCLLRWSSALRGSGPGRVQMCTWCSDIWWNH